MATGEDELKRAVEAKHGGRAKHSGRVVVEESFDGKTVWHGLVEVYDLADHPKANRAYAWVEPMEGRGNRICTVLGIGPIVGPVEAVRAYIVAQHRAKQGG